LFRDTFSSSSFSFSYNVTKIRNRRLSISTPSIIKYTMLLN
jgi:hypothetical protein